MSPYARYSIRKFIERVSPLPVFAKEVGWFKEFFPRDFARHDFFGD